MNQAFDTKLVSVLPPDDYIDSVAVSGAIDTAGFDQCQIVLQVGDTTSELDVLKVQHSDDSAMAGAVDLLAFGTSVDISGAVSSLPGAGDDRHFFVFDINCRSAKRYLDLTIQAPSSTTAAYLSAMAILSRAKVVPTTAAQRGAANVLRN